MNSPIRLGNITKGSASHRFYPRPSGSRSSKGSKHTHVGGVPLSEHMITAVSPLSSIGDSIFDMPLYGSLRSSIGGEDELALRKATAGNEGYYLSTHQRGYSSTIRLSDYGLLSHKEEALRLYERAMAMTRVHYGVGDGLGYLGTRLDIRV